jgi:hypothetical protein
MADKNEKIALKVYGLQNAIVRELNNIHIFVRQALPLLEEARSVHAQSTNKKDRRYYVPSIKRTKFAQRTDSELKKIYDQFTASRLYESFLITAISEFEEFVGKILHLIISQYPKKLSISVTGIQACRTISVDLLLEGQDPATLLDQVIEEHLRGVFFAAPKTYMEYLSKVAQVEVKDSAFAKYYELKATRDLLVHGNRKINSIYLEKAGTEGRGQVGDSIMVDSDYFDSSLAIMKQLSGAIKRDIEKAYRPNPKRKQSGAS